MFPGSTLSGIITRCGSHPNPDSCVVSCCHENEKGHYKGVYEGDDEYGDDHGGKRRITADEDKKFWKESAEFVSGGYIDIGQERPNAPIAQRGVRQEVEEKRPGEHDSVVVTRTRPKTQEKVVEVEVKEDVIVATDNRSSTIYKEEDPREGRRSAMFRSFSGFGSFNKKKELPKKKPVLEVDLDNDFHESFML